MEWFVSIQNLPYSDQLTILFIFTAAQFIAILAQNFLLIVGAVCVALTFYFRKTLATESIHYIFMLVNLPSANWIFPYFVVDGWGLTCACSLIVIIYVRWHTWRQWPHRLSFTKIGLLLLQMATLNNWRVRLISVSNFVFKCKQNIFLLEMNSACRSIDMIFFPVARIAVGQLMYFVGSHI